MTKHLDEGTLRRYLDEPEALDDRSRTHLTGCPRCTTTLAEVTADRDAVAALFVLPGDETGEKTEEGVGDERFRTAAGWVGLTSRLEEATAAGLRAEGIDLGADVRRPAWTVVRRPVAVAVAASVVALGGTAAAAANDLLPMFRTEKVAPVSFSTKDIEQLDPQRQLAWLSTYGDFTESGEPRAVPATNAEEASRRAGFPAPVTGPLPQGVKGTPAYSTIGAQSVTFTFSQAKADRTVTAHGGTVEPLPSGLDGTVLTISTGPVVIETWSQRTGQPSLAVARTKAPTATTKGASLTAVRDFVLSRTGVPTALAGQLKALSGDWTTLPIPVPTDRFTSEQVTVGRANGTLVQTRDRTLAATVWVNDGYLAAVGGSIDRDEALAVARALR